MNELKYGYGTELTFHRPKGRFIQRDILNADLLEEFGAQANWHYEADYCFEINSPVLCTWERFRAFYEFVRAQAKARGLRVRVRGWSTGGGHLHVSQAGGWSEGLKKFIREDRCQRPYLTWVFNDPEDDSIHHANGGFYSRDYSELKRFAITVRLRTLEFRLFEMPRNWDEQVLHILFCEHYLSWAEGRKAAAQVEAPQWSFNTAKRSFNAFLEEIGLDPYPYSMFVDCNLKARFS